MSLMVVLRMSHTSIRRKPTSVLIKTGGSTVPDGRDSIGIRIYQSGSAGRIMLKRGRASWRMVETQQSQFPENRATARPHFVANARSIDIQIIYLTDPSRERRRERDDGGNSARGWPPYVTWREGQVCGGPADSRGDHLLPPGGSQLTPETTVFR